MEFSSRCSDPRGYCLDHSQGIQLLPCLLLVPCHVRSASSCSYSFLSLLSSCVRFSQSLNHLELVEHSHIHTHRHQDSIRQHCSIRGLSDNHDPSSNRGHTRDQGGMNDHIHGLHSIRGHIHHDIRDQFHSSHGLSHGAHIHRDRSHDHHLVGVHFHQ